MVTRCAHVAVCRERGRGTWRMKTRMPDRMWYTYMVQGMAKISRRGIGEHVYQPRAKAAIAEPRPTATTLPNIEVSIVRPRAPPVWVVCVGIAVPVALIVGGAVEVGVDEPDVLVAEDGVDVGGGKESEVLGDARAQN